MILSAPNCKRDAGSLPPEASVMSYQWGVKIMDGRSYASQPVSLKYVRLLGTPVACATYDSALARIKELAREARPTAACPANTHIIGEARNNVAFARILARFE